MNVSLTPELEKFVADKISTGRYQSASEVIREGLRLLEERDRKPAFMVSSESELREKIEEGIRSLDQGNGVPGEVALAELRQRAAKGLKSRWSSRSEVRETSPCQQTQEK